MKRKSKKEKAKPKAEGTRKEEDSEDEQNFSNWLRSDQGVESMKLFVLANTVFIFLMMIWPKMKEAFDAGYYLYYDFFPRRDDPKF